MAVTGCNFVRFTRHGLQSIRSYWRAVGDRIEVRRQALKLRFWDERHTHGHGMLFDHGYESIKAIFGLRIFELRLDDEIGGQRNIRVIFLDPPDTWIPMHEHSRPLRVVWVIEALPRRRNDWTTNDITRFRGSRLLIQKRFYLA
jgi:hypothetical protein